MSDVRARVLVTGSTGLIGAPLVDRLRAAGLEVHGASRTPSDSPFSHRADLGSPQEARELVAVIRPTTIVHLAGGGAVDQPTLYAVNALTLVNIMQAAAFQSLPASVIALGSAAEYGEPVDGIARESSPTDPVSDYGRAKLAASALARSISDGSGVGLAIARPFNIVSPSLPTSSALGNIRRQLLTQAGERRSVVCGRLDIIRDFVPLRFVVDALATIVALDSRPRVINICSGRGMKLGDILDEMAARLRAHAEVEVLPELAAIPAASRIVGDATLLAKLGLSCEPTVDSVAELLLSDKD